MATNMVIKEGDIGIGVNKLQGYLNLIQERNLITTRNLQDGVFGFRTVAGVQEYQQYAKLPVTGIIDYDTFSSIVNTIRSFNIVTNIPVASRTYMLAEGSRGLDVFMMQEYLNEIAAVNSCLRPIPVDGIFGPRTAMAVSQFQYLYDQNVDSIIGKATWDAIVNERNNITR